MAVTVSKRLVLTAIKSNDCTNQKCDYFQKFFTADEQNINISLVIGYADLQATSSNSPVKGRSIPSVRSNE